MTNTIVNRWIYIHLFDNIKATDIEDSLYSIIVSSVLVTFLLCFLALEGQQNTAFIEIFGFSLSQL